MPWWKKSSGELVEGDKKPDDTSSEFKPDDLKKDIDKSIDDKLKAFSDTISTGMKPMQEMAETMKKEREAREKAEKEAREKAKKEDEGSFEDNFILDPAGAVKNLVESATSKRDPAIIALASRQVTQDTLGDEEFYHGKVKQDTDKYIAGLPANQKTDPATIKNCFKLAYMDNLKEIQEGKIKSRTSEMSNFGNNGTGGHSGKSSAEADESLNDVEKKIAASLGISDKDYAASKKDMAFV